MTAISELGIDDQEPVVVASARALVELELDQERGPIGGVPSSTLLERLECPKCGGALDDPGVCRSCGETFEGEGGLLDLR